MNKAGIILGILCCAVAGHANETPFEHYQLIIDKQPFGSEPVGTEIVQVDASQSFARNLRLSMLFEGPDGQMRAGVISTADKKSYILSIGESEDGIELIEADMEASEALLRKGNEVALFKLEGGSTEAAQPEKPPTRQSSYAERRRALLKKIEERRQKADETPPEPQLKGEALRKHLEEVQMDAIRKGLPPLPMPLTPEMDAQLVSEGVLPPQ